MISNMFSDHKCNVCVGGMEMFSRYNVAYACFPNHLHLSFVYFLSHSLSAVCCATFFHSCSVCLSISICSSFIKFKHTRIHFKRIHLKNVVSFKNKLLASLIS